MWVCVKLNNFWPIFSLTDDGVAPSVSLIDRVVVHKFVCNEFFKSGIEFCVQEVGELKNLHSCMLINTCKNIFSPVVELTD